MMISFLYSFERPKCGQTSVEDLGEFLGSQSFYRSSSVVCGVGF